MEPKVGVVEPKVGLVEPKVGLVEPKVLGVAEIQDRLQKYWRAW